MCQVQLSYNNGSHHHFIQPVYSSILDSWRESRDLQRYRKFCVLSELLAFQESGLNHDQLLQQSHYTYICFIVQFSGSHLGQELTTSATFFFLPSLFFPFCSYTSQCQYQSLSQKMALSYIEAQQQIGKGEYESVAKEVGKIFHTCPMKQNKLKDTL